MESRSFHVFCLCCLYCSNCGGADLTNLLNGEASVAKVIPSRFVKGVTAAQNKIFVITWGKTTISLYDEINFNTIPSMTMRSLKDPSDIVYYAPSECIYISDEGNSQIHQIHLSNTELVRSWDVKQKPLSLSVSAQGTLFLICFDDPHIYEYSSDGSLLRQIKLDSSISHPWHAVQLQDGNFVVGHGFYPNYIDTALHRVLIVNSNGEILKSVGREWGNDPDQFNLPKHIAVSRDGSILVGDQGNDRIKLFTNDLEYMGDVQLAENYIRDPRRIYLDEAERRLYVGEFFEHEVLVIDY